MTKPLVSAQKWKLWLFGVAVALFGVCRFAPSWLAELPGADVNILMRWGPLGACLLLVVASFSMIWPDIRKQKASEWRSGISSVIACLRWESSHGSIRFHKNAPGDFYTTGECLACGVPEDEAPECLAALDDSNSDTYFARQPTTPEETEKVCRAAKACCVDAIRYAGKDQNIMKRLGSAYCDHWVSHKA